MNRPLYSARIGESCCIAERVPYDALLNRILEFTVRAALARCVDESDWEHDQLRRRGIGAIQFFRDAKAVWPDSALFDVELAEARREGVEGRFRRQNEADPTLHERIDADLQARWRAAGFDSRSLASDMKKLFAELEREASERAESARDNLLGELLRGLSGRSH